MKTGLIIAIVVIVIVAIVGFSIRSKRKEDRRRKAMADWAQSKGLSSRTGKDSGIDARFPNFRCLQQGDSGRYGYNIMEGPIGNRKVCAFDYHYETHTHYSKEGQNVREHCFSAVVVETDLPLKPLSIRTENFLDKIGELVGIDDINFESTEFNKQFHVKSPDKKWAYDVVNQATMEFLLKSPRFTIEFQGHEVMAYRNNTFPAADFEAALQLLAGILDRLPKSLSDEKKAEKL